MRVSKKELERRLGILDILSGLYPKASCSLEFRNPLELLVATILSAQCTDERVNIVTRELFKKYVSARDYAEASIATLERDIHSIGFYRNKARNIVGMARMLIERHGGEVPSTMEELVLLPGVGRKTANVVLGNAFKKNEGIAVDTHVGRISGKLGFTKHADPEKIERDLTGWIPREQWAVIAHRIIQHGRKTCKARKPACGSCELSGLCPSSGKGE